METNSTKAILDIWKIEHLSRKVTMYGILVILVLLAVCGWKHWNLAAFLLLLTIFPVLYGSWKLKQKAGRMKQEMLRSCSQSKEMDNAAVF